MKSFSVEELNTMERNISTVLDCIAFSGVGSNKADVINRRLNEVLDILRKGNVNW